MHDDRPIGIFDSGVGGLTVMRQLMHKLPNESLIYFGDTARLPYGGKSAETIMRYSMENAAFLLEKDIKVLVIACNTSCAYALDRLSEYCSIPVVGVIDPGAERAVDVTKNGHIAILGTKATILSGKYEKEIKKRLPEAQVLSLACPLFVPIVEERFVDHLAARLIVQEYLKPLITQKVDTILLGCTHYPLLAKVIQEEVGSDVTIIDSALTCADHVFHLLNQQGLQNNPSNQPSYQYFVSDDPHRFASMGQEIIKLSMPNVELVSSYAFNN
jgi:glutamate racemase